MGDTAGADLQFRKALACSTANHASHYFYARFLYQHGSQREAIGHLEAALRLAPAYAEAYVLLLSIYHEAADWQSLELLTAKILAASPDDADARKYAAICSS